MTKLLSRAVAEVSKLPEPEQDAIASRWLAELTDEDAWQRSFAASQDLLARMADEALAEDAQGLTHDLDPDRL